MATDELLSRAQERHRAGQLDKAREYYQAVLRADPDQADAHYGLGTVHHQEGSPSDAHRHLLRAVELMPEVPEFTFNLGLVEEQLGLRRRADERFVRAARLAVDDAGLLVPICRKLSALGRDREVSSIISGTGTVDPSLLELAARSQARLGDWAGARSSLRPVVAARPDDAAVQLQLATAAAHLRDFPEAIAAYRRHVALTGETAANQLGYADLLLMARRFREAAEAVDRARALGADGADAEYIAARCERLAGNYRAARDHLRRATRVRPGFGDAWWLLVELEEDTAAFERLADTCHRLARSEGRDLRNSMLLALAAGHAHSRLGHFDAAFADFEFGNAQQQTRLAQRGTAYDPLAAEADATRIIELFNEPAPRRDSSALSTYPIFVVGLPRSGTTVVERILAALDGVEAGGENEAMEFVASRYLWELDRGRAPLPAALSPGERTRLASEYWIRTGGGPRRLVDKLPHNFRNVGLIALLFPGAPILYMRRDPRDVALSIYGRPFPDGHAYACDLAAIGHFYAQSERLHDHWRRLLPEQMLDVDYQELVRDPEASTRRIADFCGLRWDAACLRFQEREGASFTFSELQVRQALNDRGIGRWRRYERHLGPLMEALQQTGARPQASWMPDPPDEDVRRVWFPCGIDAGAETVRFCRVLRDELADATFLDEGWSRSGFELRTQPLADLTSGPSDAAPRFIWHSAFCCSTLLARCLDSPGTNLSLKEPAVLMEAANLKRAHGEAVVNAWLQPLVQALAGAAVPERCATIKPGNAANNLITNVARLFPEARHLCLTSDLRSFIISIAKRGEEGRAFARRLFTIFALDGHEVAKLEWRRLMQMSDLQVAALVWHMQISGMVEAMRQGGPEVRFSALDADTLLRDPAHSLSRVNDFFELGLSEGHIAETSAGPLFHRDAKDAGRAYDPVRRADEAERVAASLGSELDAIIDWSYGVFPDAPRDGRLPGAL